jgi:prepilin-type N-terminal cleavage/methylation domain-containing protein
MRRGFSLVELIFVMAVSGILTVAIYTAYIKLYSGAKQQSKIAESSVESYIGTEILRTDLVNMGLGIAANEVVTGTSNKLYPVGWDNSQEALSIYTTYDRLDPMTHGWRLLKCNNSQICEYDDATTGLGTERYAGLKVISSLNNALISPSIGNVSSADFFYAVGYPYDTSKPDKYRTITYRLATDCDADGKSDVAIRCATGTKTLCRNNVPMVDCVAGWKVYGGYQDSEGVTYNTMANISSLNSGANLAKIRRLAAYLLVQEGQYDKEFKFNSDVIKKDLDFDIANDPLDEVQFNIPAGSQNYRWNLLNIDVRTYNVVR